MENNFSKNLLSNLNQKNGEIKPVIYGNPKLSRQDMIEQNKFNIETNIQNRQQPNTRNQPIGKVDPMQNIQDHNQGIRKAASFSSKNFKI